MKICAAQAMIAIILCGISMANTGYSQLLDKEVTINLVDVSFEKALLELGDAAKVKFAYSLDQLDVKETVTIEASRTPLHKVLDALLTPHNIHYKVHDRESVISLKRQGSRDNHQSSINDSNQETPTRQVTGKVTDVNGDPLAGVNIIVKGTTNGTSTDANGKFSIVVDNEDDLLVFSFIGYTPVEIRIASQTVVDITLHEDVSTLGEVVVNAGYWQVKEREQTGTIGRVSSEDINKQPVSSPLMALQGRIPGVVISPVTGIAGGAQTIQIRGQNSLRTDGNYPLYVIDGVPVDSRPIQSVGLMFAGGLDPISTLNPENIESIEVLKDADATAVYGSRGANGVILITTKKSKEGQTAFDLQFYQGAGKVSRMMDVLNTEQYLSMRNEAFNNDGPAALSQLNNPANAIYYPDLKLWDSARNTNWQKELFGSTSGISDLQATISGGNASTSFRIGGGFHRESTVFPGDFGYQKATANTNFNHTSGNKRFSMGLSINYGIDRNNLFNNNPVYTALTLAPNAPGYDEQGDLVWTGYDASMANPFSRLRLTHNAKASSLIVSSRLSYELFKGFKVLASVGLTDIRSSEELNTPKSAMPPWVTTPNSTVLGNRSSGSWIAEPQVTYTRDISKGKLDILVGTSWQNSESESLYLRGIGYVSDELLGNINAASQVTKMSADMTTYRYSAVFSRLAFNWAERYYLNLTARRDGSSRFGPDSRFSNFGAIGLAWIFTNESFFVAHTNVMSFGKLRFSYGTTGNDQIGDYGYLSTYTAAAETYDGNSILVPSNLSNPNYAWEVNKKLEAAIDLGFFRDRLNVAFNYYRNRSNNQLVGYPLPSITGFRTVQANLDAVVQNSGLEFSIESVNIKRDGFSWTTSVNLTVPRNELLSYPNLAGSTYANTYVVGQPLTINKVYHSTGVDPETGLYQFLDTDGNNVINTQDRQTVVNIGRQYYGGFTNRIKCGPIELAIFFDYVKQQVRGYRGTFLSAPGMGINQPAFLLDQQRWQNPGDASQLQRFTTKNTTYSLARSSDLNYDDGAFIRLKTVSLSYKLPSGLLGKIHLRDASLFVHGQNLFVITNYKGLDPEIPGNSQLPQLRMITGGINLKI